MQKGEAVFNRQLGGLFKAEAKILQRLGCGKNIRKP